MKPAEFDPHYMCKVLSELLSDQYGEKITVTAVRKETEKGA